MIDGLDYYNYREDLASDLKRGLCQQDSKSMVNHVAKNAGVDPNTAAEFVERFFDSVTRTMEARKNSQPAPLFLRPVKAQPK